MLLGARTHEILLAEGKVLEVLVREDRAVFLRVELQRYPNEDGSGLEALCRLLVPYHGATHGDWHVPDVDLDVVCLFPGGGHDGAPGGDLGEGYAIGFISSLQEPPVATGVENDALSSSRRIYRGKPGEAHDVKIDGVELRENVGVVKRLFRAAVQWLGDTDMTVQAWNYLTLKGRLLNTVESDWIVNIQGALMVQLGTSGYTNSVKIEPGQLVVIKAPSVLIQDREFMDHKHDGVQPGSGETGGVV